MVEVVPSVNQTSCEVIQIDYCLPSALCDRCRNPASSSATASRVAIDVNLECPVLLHVDVSVHHCPDCHHYFRAQPPFLRPRAIYTNRVVGKAVQSVYGDDMAMRRVTERMARDFWVRPSEGIVRSWCSIYSAGFDLEVDYQPWVVDEFSGILCVDELYQNQLALLLAADPAAPDGDRLVGYQLVHGTVNAADVERFLSHLKKVGVEPDQVVTDGSNLYPTVLARVWPGAAHQLCLFHQTRHVTRAVMKVITAVRKELPHPPRVSATRGGGPLRDRPPSEDPTDPATQRWHWRQWQRRTQMAQVHALAEKGLSQRAVARQTGHHRDTIKRWLGEPIPPLPEGMPPELPEMASWPVPRQRQAKKRALMRRAHSLREQGRSYSAIARQIGVHRVTVKSWLQERPPREELIAPSKRTEPSPPPVPWSSWDEVQQIRESLREHRFLLLRRPETLDADEQEMVTSLLTSPAGGGLGVARSFLVDWYRLWTHEDGERRSLSDARRRYEAWRTNPDYHTIPPLRRIQEQMTEVKFESLSHFLRHPTWEATNNGAERVGRAFRHQQRPHFRLRTEAAIENKIKVTACLRKHAATRSPARPFHTCQRGRKRRQEPLAPAVLSMPDGVSRDVAPPVFAAPVETSITQSLSSPP